MFQVFSSSGTAAAAGVFIPLADLPGLSQSEIETTGAELEGNLIYSLLNAFYMGLNVRNTLGIVGLSKTNPQGNGTNRYTEGVGFGYQRLINYKTGTIAPIPLPTIGTEAGAGDCAIAYLFSGAQIKAQNAAIPGAGIVIPHALVADYGATSPTNTGNDARDWIGALLIAMAANTTLRSATVPSAITSRVSPATLRSVGIAIPPTWYDANNPITGISPEDLPYSRIIQDTITIEYELMSDADAQTFSLSIRTTGA
jgi:hypothetical protein